MSSETFVPSDLGVLPLLPRCYAHPARLLPARAESGRQNNIYAIGTQNLGLRADGQPCSFLNFVVDFVFSGQNKSI